MNEYSTVIGAFINTVLVLVVVQLIKTKLFPIINEKCAWTLPIIAGGVGPGMAVLQTYLGKLLGVAIDLSPVVAIFTGASATALHQVGNQYAKQAVKIVLMAFLLMSLVSCATPWQNKAVSAYVTSAQLVTIGEQTAQPACAVGTFPADKCIQLRTIYVQICQGMRSAGLSLILAISLADAIQQQNALTNYNTLMVQVQEAFKSYVDLYNSLQPKQARYAINPALIQVAINAFIAIVQAIPGLSQAFAMWGQGTVDVAALTTQIQAAMNSLPVWEAMVGFKSK